MARPVYKYEVHRYNNVHRNELQGILNHYARDGGRIVHIEEGPNYQLMLVVEYEVESG